MLRIGRGLAALAPLLLVWAAAGCGRDGRTLAVVGGTIIDGTGRIIPDGVLVVAGGRIRCVGTSDECAVGDADRSVDAAGFWIAPGYIDTHVHPRYGSDPAGTRYRERLRFLLGVTTTRDAGTPGDFEANLQAAARAREPGSPVPRLVVSATLPTEAPPSDSAVGAWLEERMAGGAAVLGVSRAPQDPALRVLIDSARALGMPIVGDLTSDTLGSALAGALLSAGVDGLSGVAALARLAAEPEERGPGSASVADSAPPAGSASPRPGPEDVATELADRGLWLEPLLLGGELRAAPYRLPVGLHRLLELSPVVDALRDPPELAGLPEAERVRFAEAVARQRELVRLFHRAGGTVVTGTDGALAPGLSLLEEMRSLVDAGLSPRDALMAATADAARALGVIDSLGTLEPGKLADFVVLEGDPLADIANAQLVARVAKGGHLHDPAVLLGEVADDLTARTSPAIPRLLFTLLAMLLALGGAAWAIRRHAASTPSTWRER